MPDEHPAKHQVRLGAVQETLFITLAARARPLSLDPAATVFVLAGYLAALAPPKARR